MITWRSQTYLVGQTNRKQCHDDLVVSSSCMGCDLVTLPIRTPACDVAGHLSLMQSLPGSVMLECHVWGMHIGYNCLADFDFVHLRKIQR